MAGKGPGMQHNSGFILMESIVILLMSSRRSWTPREDEVFRRIAQDYQPKNWAVISKRLASEFGFKRRTGKQCRERWYNHLDPSISKKGWSKKDEEQLLSLHNEFGNKWTAIAQRMSGRSDNSIKNYFYSTVRRNLRRMGKLLGSKNSTGLMREIKPSTMTRIFGSLNEQENQTLCAHLEREGLTKDYMRQSCENIRKQIIHFSEYKPKKSDKIGQEEKDGYEKVFELLQRVNEIYEKVREEEKEQRTDKQLFRHYYQEMNRESSQEVDKEEESDDEDMQGEGEGEKEVEPAGKRNSREVVPETRTTRRKVQQQAFQSLSFPKLEIFPSNTKNYEIKIPLPLQAERPAEYPLDSSTLSREKLPQQSGLASIVEYAEEIEFNDPDFNIQINDDKPAENMGSLEIDVSKMSFRSPACSFGTPVSQVNFFKSPRNIRVTCLTDYLMRLSSSRGREEWDMAMSRSMGQSLRESLRDQERQNSAKKLLE